MIWTLLWVGWLLAFLAIEIPAVIRPAAGDTLYEHFWRFLGRGQQRTEWIRLRRVTFLAFSAWLVVHLFTGWV
jgi:hypothetical protein